MNAEVKNTLDHMIKLVNDRNFKSGLFAAAEKKLSRPIVYALNRDILAWNNEFFINLNQLNPEKWSLETDDFDEIFEQNLIEFLKVCPAVGHIFKVEDHNVKFNPNFSSEDIAELRLYVTENQPVKMESKETRQKN